MEVIFGLLAQLIYRQIDLTKLGINLLFVSENVLLYDFHESFQMQECSLTLWSRNRHMTCFVSSVCYFEEFPASREKLS